MKRRSVGGAWSLWVLAALMVVTALPASAADLWLDEDFEDGTDGLLTNIVDPLDPLANGHIGAGAPGRIPDGGNWGASGRWNFDDTASPRPRSCTGGTT
jgi:hypothetical protein